MDHLGSNHPTPPMPVDPLNGYKMPRANPQQRYHFVNAIRPRWFTSATEFDAFAAESINGLFRNRANTVFRDANFGADDCENCALLIGSPRIEVGIDLDRVGEGITYRALRDPASAQQKAGRVGRELRSDSIVLHLVTENAGDHYYFRDPRIALDGRRARYLFRLAGRTGPRRGDRALGDNPDPPPSTFGLKNGSGLVSFQCVVDPGENASAAALRLAAAPGVRQTATRPTGAHPPILHRRRRMHSRRQGAAPSPHQYEGWPNIPLAGPCDRRRHRPHPTGGQQ
jgi:hypothetical protein